MKKRPHRLELLLFILAITQVLLSAVIFVYYSVEWTSSYEPVAPVSIWTETTLFIIGCILFGLCVLAFITFYLRQGVCEPADASDGIQECSKPMD